METQLLKKKYENMCPHERAYLKVYGEEHLMFEILNDENLSPVDGDFFLCKYQKQLTDLCPSDGNFEEFGYNIGKGNFDVPPQEEDFSPLLKLEEDMKNNKLPDYFFTYKDYNFDESDFPVKNEIIILVEAFLERYPKIITSSRFYRIVNEAIKSLDVVPKSIGELKDLILEKTEREIALFQDQYIGMFLRSHIFNVSKLICSLENNTDREIDLGILVEIFNLFMSEKNVFASIDVDKAYNMMRGVEKTPDVSAAERFEKIFRSNRTKSARK